MTNVEVEGVHLLDEILLESNHTSLTANHTEYYHLANNQTSLVSQPVPFQRFYKIAQISTGLVCYPIICLAGVVGNIFIIALLGRPSQHTTTNIYLCALAVSDLIKLLNDTLYFFTVLFYTTDPILGNKAFGYLYPYAHFVFNLAACVSSWLTVTIAVERYMLVCHPMRARGLISLSRARTATVAIFIVMTSLAVPSGLRYRTVHRLQEINGRNVTMLDVQLTSLWRVQEFVVAYTWLQSLLRSIIPFLILLAVNAAIITALRRMRARRSLACRNRITVMLIVVLVVFLLCITPDAVMSAFFNAGYAESNYLVRGVREITDMLLSLNAAINFWLYFVFNQV